MNTLQKQSLFWDVEEKDLSLLTEEVIISRTLSHGTFEQVQALFSSYSKEHIRAVFRTLKVGALSERRRDYFTLILA